MAIFHPFRVCYTETMTMTIESSRHSITSTYGVRSTYTHVSSCTKIPSALSLNTMTVCGSYHESLQRSASKVSKRSISQENFLFSYKVLFFDFLLAHQTCSRSTGWKSETSSYVTPATRCATAPTCNSFAWMAHKVCGLRFAVRIKYRIISALMV